MAKLSSVAINSANAQMMGKEVCHWLPRLRFIYTNTHRLARGFTGNAPQKNVAYRAQLNREWVHATRTRNPVDKFGIASTYIRRWGGLVANSDNTILDYASKSNRQLIDLGTRGIASWSKLLAVRNPRKYPIYDARVAFSLNALQAIINGTIDHWFHVPSTRITWIAGHLATLRGLCSAHADIPAGRHINSTWTGMMQWA